MDTKCCSSDSLPKNKKKNKCLKKNKFPEQKQKENINNTKRAQSPQLKTLEIRMKGYQILEEFLDAIGMA